MTTATALFNYNDHKIRVVDIDHQPWFVAADVLTIFGVAKTNRFNWTSRLAADEKGNSSVITQRGGQQKVTIISESGLYKLIMRSDKPEARAFQDWVTRIVLPAIRKDGGYIVGEEKVATGEMDEDTLILKAMEVMRRKIDRLAEEKEKLQAENKKLADELNFVTLDEWRALHHIYLHKADSSRVSQLASKYHRERGLKIEQQERVIHRGTPLERRVFVNVYQSSIVTEAAKAMGVIA